MKSRIGSIETGISHLNDPVRNNPGAVYQW